MPRNRPDLLATYRSMRSADATPEPFGSLPGEGARSPGGARRFVVQQHAATRDHYDFRLEWNGVLLSWAVPKGPSSDPADKRLAMRTEDHPVEYADFEGVIPAGNYGAGPVIVWDRGSWVAREDLEQGLVKGKLLFELHGLKLRGVWTLVRTHSRRSADPDKEWLLIKERDGFARAQPYPPGSIFSGLTPRERALPRSPGVTQVLATLERLNAPRRKVRADTLGPMLPETRERAFTDKEWLFELKYDGFRLFAARDEGRSRLIYRRGLDSTAFFPDVVSALDALPFSDAVFDGEVVVLDEQNRPRFHRLQQRTQLTRAADLARASISHPATVFLFDLLAFEGFDLTPLPLHQRKALLQQLLPRFGVLRPVEDFAGQGERLYDAATGLGFEGIIGKKRDSPYRAGRSPLWIKVRREHTVDFVIVGFTLPDGARSGLGALQLGAYRDGQLRYVGKAGSGLSHAQLLTWRRTLEALMVPRPPCVGPLPGGRGNRWVQPLHVCEVRFTEWTHDGLLRQPVFLRMRPDKAPRECVLDEGSAAHPVDPAPPPPMPVERTLTLTHPEKVFWPEDGLTKGDLVDYYRAVSPWLLPYLRDRPLVMTRFPDGIRGKSFFQKDAPRFAPAWLRQEHLWNQDSEREIGYLIADDVESLLYAANSASIPLHIWSSRVAQLQHPDWCILDLDPKSAPFAHVITLARAAHRLCDDLELPSFLKTTGSSGLHVLIPLGQQLTHAESRSLAELLARVLVSRHPTLATVVRDPAQREGKVYVDYLQNGFGKLLVSPYSVRPLPTAPVSMPLRWNELTSRLTPTQWTLQNALARLRKQEADPLLQVLSEKPDLPRALARLGEQLKEKAAPAKRAAKPPLKKPAPRKK